MCPPVYQKPSATQPSYHQLRDRRPMRSPSMSAVSVGSRGDRSSGQFSMPPYGRQSMDGVHPRGAPPQMQGVVMSQPWPDKYTSGVENAAIDPYHHIFDQEMSSDGTNDPIGISGHPTPSNSHHAPSHSSYSPRTDDGHIDGSHVSRGRPVQQAPYYAANQFQSYTTGASYPSHNPTSGAEYGMSGIQNDWGIDAAAPAMGDQAWAALDAIGWSDSNSMGVPLETWRQLHPDVHGVTR